MKSKVLVVYADREPMAGVRRPGPHQLYRNARVRLEERQMPALCPDEIRVEMAYAGICGTDLHLLQSHPETGYTLCSAPTVIPPEGRIIGHEGVGKVIACGENVSHLKVGAYVTFESIIVCHFCDLCRQGQFNQCRNARLLGLQKDGLFATICDVPAMLAHDVTCLIRGDRDLRAAACVEPAGVAYGACQKSRIKAGDVVVVFGAGPIGLLAALLARNAFGASEVHVVEPVRFRREFAGKWFDSVYDVETFFQKGPDCVDVVVEASGHLDNINRVFDRIAANGRVALLARSGVALKLEALDHMITNAISITGSRGPLGGAFKRILNLYQKGRIPLHEIVTDVVEGSAALRELLSSPKDILDKNCKVLARLED